MTALNIVEALNLALKQELARDKTVVILGEDVGKNGGVFRVTDGLWKNFGDDRVIDTPLSEVGIIGTSIGLAMNGFKPVAEAQFNGFSMAMLDQLINHASRIRWRTQGRFSCPLVLRIPVGGGIRALEHHSDSPETYFAHIPGLKVVEPATPYDAKGLLSAAIRDPDPVIFLEPLKLYRAFRQEVPEDDYDIPIGKANVVREGSDITLISYGAMLHQCLEAAENVKDKYNCEVIDLRTLKPIDTETIVNSVKKTGRCIIVHESPRYCSISSEIAARIVENAFLNLETPITRVTGFDTTLPLPKLESYYLPNSDKIAKAIEKTMTF